MNIHLSTTVRNARATAIVNALSGGTLKAYSGTMPTTGGDAITTQTLLGTLTFANPAGTVSAGVLTFTILTDDASVDADGTWTWARCLDSSNAWVMDVDVSNNAGTGVIRLPNITVYAGGVLRVSGGTITEGNS